MTIDVTKQTAYAALLAEGLLVSKQTAYVALMAKGMAITKQTAYVLFLAPPPPLRRRPSPVVNWVNMSSEE